jgi:hypothetical protein
MAVGTEADPRCDSFRYSCLDVTSTTDSITDDCIDRRPWDSRIDDIVPSDLSPPGEFSSISWKKLCSINLIDGTTRTERSIAAPAAPPKHTTVRIAMYRITVSQSRDAPRICLNRHSVPQKEYRCCSWLDIISNGLLSRARIGPDSSNPRC